MPVQPMIFFPYNYCLNCKTNSIEIYSWHNYAQKYQKILDFNKMNGTLPEVLDKYGIYTMRCSRCGKEYKINWQDGVPRPVINNFDINIFMTRFMTDGLAGKPNVADNIYEERMKE